MAQRFPEHDDEIVNRDEILPLLREPKPNGDWVMAFCPAHADGSKHGGKEGRSLGLSSKGVLRCFAGCTFADVMEALRKGDSRPTSIRRQQTGRTERLARVYEYRNAAGEVVGEKGRIETDGGQKTFRWRKPGEDGWPGGVDTSALTLYGSHLLAERPDEPVYVTEGEKACEAVWANRGLAVTHWGGAGVRNFGPEIEALKDRDVLLWADNDPAGREYMQNLFARLGQIARSTRFVSVPIPLPEKGDAADYFAKGGTLEQLDSASPNEPTVTLLSQDSLRVVIPGVLGPVVFTLQEIDKSSRAFDCILSVECKASSESAYKDRINIFSATAKTELRRTLQEIYGKDYQWPQTLNRAFNLAQEAYLGLDRAVDVFEIPDGAGELFLVDPLIPADAPTIFFGDGGSGKSYITDRFALGFALGLDLGRYDFPAVPVMVIDYEDNERNFRRRMKRLCEGIEPGLTPAGVLYWNASGVPLKDQWEAIKRSCDKNGVGVIIIDSAGPACGGAPEDADVALAYKRALDRIGRTSITIAHTTKAGENQKPYGSVFWHNFARRTWFVARRQDDEADDIDLGLFCRKVNDGRRPAPIAFHLSFKGDNGPVLVSPGRLEDSPELQDAYGSPEAKVRATLKEGQKSVQEIMEATGLHYKDVDNVLRRKGGFVQTGTREGKGTKRVQLWGLMSDLPEPEGSE